MSSIYSVSVVAAKEATSVPDYVVPVGFVLVVVDIDVYWGNQIVPPTGRVLGAAGQAFWSWAGSILAPNHAQWRGRHVITAPGHLSVAVDGGNIDVSIAGYLLTLP